MSDGARLADTVDFSLLGDALGADVEASLTVALDGGSVLLGSSDPLSLFREALASSIRDIEDDTRGVLFQRFLRDGPYDGQGETPPESPGQRLSDEETAKAVSFISGHMVKSFQGKLAELLALAPCVHLLQDQRRAARMPQATRLYVGDAVVVGLPNRSGFAKGADMHLLSEERTRAGTRRIAVIGVVEVKSYLQSWPRLGRQLDQHLARLGNGVKVGSQVYDSIRIRVGARPGRRAAKIAVVPSDWVLPRSFHFELHGDNRRLVVDAPEPPGACDRIAQVGDDDWRITLKWSKEALAATAHAMTFWYMEKVGEVIYSQGVPKEWSEMTPAEAGRNAITMMLYYAILRYKTRKQAEPAIALYNSYGFGYALGMNFRDSKGRREMLWPADLDEIVQHGVTEKGCRIVGRGVNRRAGG